MTFRKCGGSSSVFDRLHADRATIGPEYNPLLVPDTSVPDGNLFVSQRIGVGTTTPNEQIEITGNIRIPNSTAAPAAGILFKGTSRFLHNIGTNNTFAGVGAGSLRANTTGTFNTALGTAPWRPTHRERTIPPWGVPA